MNAIIRDARVVAMSAVLAMPLAAQTSVPHYRVIARVAIGTLGDGYQADFVNIDPVHRRLYGLGNAILDIDRDSVVGSIPGKFAGGYALATDLGKGLARNGTLFDLAAGHVTGHIDARGDASVYDSTSHRVFLMGVHDTVTAVDMVTGQIVARRYVAPEMESAVTDGAGSLFINREDSSVLTKVNVQSLTVEARYPIARCAKAQGLSIDRVHRRLFVGCDKAMVVVNSDNGAVVASVPVTGHADENAFDPETQLAFSANKTDSTLTVVHEDTPDTYSVIEVVKTGGPAKAVVVDPVTHKVYAFYTDFKGHEPPLDRTLTSREIRAMYRGVLTAVVLAP